MRPMLAASAPDVDAAWEQVGDSSGGVVVDGKLDGIRLQAHRDGPEVRLFTRSLDDITDRLPEVVEAVLALPATRLVIDGEAIALDGAGRPLPFQQTASRTMSSTGVEQLRAEVPVTPYFFDLLHVDGDDLLELPAAERFDRLAALVPEASLVPRITAATPAEATACFDQLVRDGHEGVVVKSPSAPYAAGRRGAGWVKVKPRHTLDLVVLAIEWGSGRRKGWLSNIHLGARDPQTGGFVMLGKTFKGMTDEMLQWQTERFTELATDGTDGYVVPVRPEQVVEIAFDGIQTSSRYPGGMALRFARVLRYRDDKTAEEADTVDTVRALR
jgi:DNA ligase-1